MQFSMDGFRESLSEDIKALRDIVSSIINEEHYDEDDLIEEMNKVITSSNVINCVFDDDNPSFNDISHIAIEHIDPDNPD